MTTKKDHIESLDEIVFANRNKDYGAYQIRKSYPRYVNRAATITILAMLIAVAVPLIASYYNQNRIIKEDKTVGAEFTEMNKPPEDAPPPPPPPPPEALEQKVKFTAPVVVEDTVVESDALNQDELAVTVTNEAVTEELVIEERVEEKVIEEEDKTPPFTVVEEMPGFPGGEESRLKFLVENIQYPQVAKESGIQGTVYVSFIVDSKGRITDARVLRGIGGGCDEEALRVIKMMPNWIPGKQAGKSVKVQFTMPIKFTLN